MSSTDNIIILKSSDGESFEVKEAVALQSRAICHLIGDVGITDDGVLLPNVTGKILSKVIDYCKMHVNDTDRDSSVAGDDLKAWDAEFVKVDQATLFDLILAANYLNIKGLLDLICQTVADKSKSGTPEEIRKRLSIKNEFTPEEEEEVRRENQWAFDEPSPSGMTGNKVLQPLPLPLDSSQELEPMMEGPQRTTILSDAEVVEGKISNELDLTGAEDRFIPEEKFDQTDAISLILKDSSIEVETRDLHHQTSPPKSPTYLYLPDRLEKLPDWISSPAYEKLTTLILKWNHLKEDPLETLGKLRELVELQLHRAYDGEQLNFKDEQFPKLKKFLLHELEGLRSMSLEKGTLPSLEILTISRCPWLTEIPSGIKDIHLNKLTLSDMSHEFYEKAKADHENDDYQIFKHIEEVYFTRWRAGYWESRTSQRTVDVKASQLNNE